MVTDTPSYVRVLECSRQVIFRPGQDTIASLSRRKTDGISEMWSSATGNFVAYGINAQAVEPLRRIELAAREVFAPWLRSLVVTGPVLKGDFVPGYSALDVHVFVTPEILRPAGAPRPDLALAFRERIGDLSPLAYGFSEFRVTVQADGTHSATPAIPAADRAGDLSGSHAGALAGGVAEPVFAPGAFRLVYGEPPRAVCEITDEGLVRAAERCLDGITEQRRRWALAVIDRTDDQLAPVTRGMGAVLEPAAYSSGVLLTGTPFRVWASDLEALGPVLDTAGLEALTAFFDGVRQWPWRHTDPDYHSGLIQRGFDAMDALYLWWAGSRDRLALASV